MDIFKTLRNLLSAATVALMALLVVSCEKERPNPQESRRALILYECGFNSLYSALRSDVNTELNLGYIPRRNDTDNVLLVYSKLASNGYYNPVKSYLRRVSVNVFGDIISDTLKVFDESVTASSPETMREVLTTVKDLFPSKSYGMIFSSHGSGWLPATYYYSPSSYEKNHPLTAVSGIKMMGEEDIPSGNMGEDDPFSEMVRSIGNEKNASGDDFEMTINEFTEGIPYHLDYLLFDMCFSGGLEVAYALRNTADYLGFSPAEVLSDGMFDYTKLCSFLIASSEPDLEGLFKNSFNNYYSQEGQYQSSTVNLVNTSGLDNLASVCAGLFDKYRNEIDNAYSLDIQGYFRENRHYFYDIEDTFIKCGASEADLSSLRSAIDACVVYKNATPRFLNLFEIKAYSGFSVYLPCHGTALLNSLYKDEVWNQATGLVK